METKTIKVQGVQVNVNQPYVAGHPITEAEAKSLNQTRAENIANNRRKVVTDLLAVEGATVESVQEAAQAAISEYDAVYEFTLASVGGGSSRLDPLEKECKKLAREWVSAQLKTQGIAQKDYLEANGEDAIKIKIAEIAEHEQIVKLAKKNLKDREALGSLTM